MQRTARVREARERYQSIIATLVLHGFAELLTDGILEASLTSALMGLWADTTLNYLHLEEIALSPKKFFMWCYRHPRDVHNAIQDAQMNEADQGCNLSASRNTIHQRNERERPQYRPAP